ncbi:hypothetical protein [Undibacterium fentianense]|uniref:Uncharacterized protein n=1 Tax=Undibacterium fentianense TaxID=2828728 RepID=A0A941IDY6_9BURK|nr:hypothetical protein [Undibacterium fentianense]MBR7800493.1 hypothetical protein [Undibacterium fentianense]
MDTSESTSYSAGLQRGIDGKAEDSPLFDLVSIFENDEQKKLRSEGHKEGLRIRAQNAVLAETLNSINEKQVESTLNNTVSSNSSEESSSYSSSSGSSDGGGLLNLVGLIGGAFALYYLYIFANKFWDYCSDWKLHTLLQDKYVAAYYYYLVIVPLKGFAGIASILKSIALTIGISDAWFTTTATIALVICGIIYAAVLLVAYYFLLLLPSVAFVQIKGLVTGDTNNRNDSYPITSFALIFAIIPLCLWGALSFKQKDRLEPDVATLGSQSESTNRSTESGYESRSKNNHNTIKPRTSIESKKSTPQIAQTELVSISPANQFATNKVPSNVVKTPESIAKEVKIEYGAKLDACIDKHNFGHTMDEILTTLCADEKKQYDLHR